MCKDTRDRGVPRGYSSERSELGIVRRRKAKLSWAASGFTYARPEVRPASGGSASARVHFGRAGMIKHRIGWKSGGLQH